MALRLRLYDCRLDRIPEVSGLCASDQRGVAAVVNTCQRRLLYAREAGEESWHGTWAEIAFATTRDAPYVVLPREVARLEMVTVCDKPAPIQNSFYEYLRFGNGRMPKMFHVEQCPQLQVYSRNSSATFAQLAPTPQLIRIYPGSAQDIGQRVFLQGVDDSGNVVYAQDGFSNAQGVFLSLDQPFAQSSIKFSQITGIQKDLTSTQVIIRQVDPVTGAESPLHTMEPTELTAWYRRYLFHPLPRNCCSGSTTPACPPSAANPAPIQITAMAKLEMIPVIADTDYCLIQNLEALTEEAESLRLGRVDNRYAKQMSLEKHAEAIRLLQGELTHYYGKNEPAFNFAPFGSARLEKVRIGML